MCTKLLLTLQNQSFLGSSRVERLRVQAPPVAELKNKKNSTECTQLYPQKMSRWLSPHPDGWDVKPEVPGDLASRGICLFQTLVSHNSGKPGRVVQFQISFRCSHVYSCHTESYCPMSPDSYTCRKHGCQH